MPISTTRAPVSSAIASATPAGVPISLKIAGHALALHLLAEVRQVGGRGLRLRAQRGDEGADQAEAVAGGEVPHRLVAGHERPLASGGMPASIRADLAVERASGGPPARVARPATSSPRSFRSTGTRPATSSPHRQRVGPDVRVVGPVLGDLLAVGGVEAAQRHQVGRVDHARPVRAGLVERVLEPLLQAEPVGDDQVGVRRARRRPWPTAGTREGRRRSASPRVTRASSPTSSRTSDPRTGVVTTTWGRSGAAAAGAGAPDRAARARAAPSSAGARRRRPVKMRMNIRFTKWS